MKQYFRFLSLFVGLFFVSVTVYAEEIPGSGIDYTTSEINVQYYQTDGSSDHFGCFNNGALGFRYHSEPLYWSGNAFAYVITRTLSDIGISDENDLADILSGSTPDDDCFQQSGFYHIQFRLVDNAGNTAYFPSNSPNPADWYIYEVKPSNPMVGTRSSDGAALTEVTQTESVSPVKANGTDTYTSTITFRDAFGNRVVQLTNTAHVDVSVLTDTVLNGGIDIDGIFEPVTSTVESVVIDASNAYDNTNSETTFANKVDIGGQTLNSLLGENGNINSIAYSGTPGVFTFAMTSTAPSMKLIDATDPAAGAGIYGQEITFDTDTREIDINGDLVVTGSNNYNLQGGALSDRYAFHSVMQAEPDISGSISWGTPTNIDTTITDNGGAFTSVERYLLTTPFSRYILRSEDSSGPEPVYVDALQPFDATGVSPDTQQLAFFPTGGTISGSPSADVGAGSQVQYFADSTTIRHTSGEESSNPSADCGADFVICYPFDPDSTARIIGADIEGAIQANRDSILIYELTGAQAGNTAGIGQQTTYAGNTTNNNVRNDLLTNVADALRSPNTDAVVSSDTTLAALATKFTTHDVVIVDGADLTIGAGNVPAGEKTVIVKDGNVFVEGDMAYASTNDSFGVIAYNTTFDRTNGSAPLTGNIFVDATVQKMVGSFYADGSLVSIPTSTEMTNLNNKTSNINTISYSSTGKSNQLVLEGVLWSNNTIGGSLIANPDPPFNGNYITPWSTTGTSDDNIARLFDLHYVRRYTGGVGCTPGPVSGCDGNDNAFVIRLDYKATYPDTAPPVFRNMGVIAR